MEKSQGIGRIVMGKEKTLLFSLTKSDFEFEYFCTGGNGGQHRNAKKNGVRCRHKASGAVAEHRDGRDQSKNKQEAFKKMANTKEFKIWHRAEVARRLGQAQVFKPMLDIEILAKVDKMMSPENIKIEYL